MMRVTISPTHPPSDADWSWHLSEDGYGRAQQVGTSPTPIAAAQDLADLLGGWLAPEGGWIGPAGPGPDIIPVTYDTLCPFVGDGPLGNGLCAPEPGRDICESCVDLAELAGITAATEETATP